MISSSEHPTPFQSEPADLDSLDRATDLLLRILAKLTVYQSLPESSSVVLSVRDDVPMADACCLLLPSDRARGCSSFASLEVLRTSVAPSLPDDHSETLLSIAGEISDHDPLLSAALSQEARDFGMGRSSGGSAYLTIADVFFFASLDQIEKCISVAEWLDWRFRVSVGTIPHGDPSVVRFCREMALVSRATMSLSPGMRSGGLCSGSSMNLSIANLIKDGVSAGTTAAGGSTLTAVTALLDRPWQLTLPLTVSSEKGVTCVFSYVNLNQLMASVAMNCSEKSLEPFFATQVTLDSGAFGFMCERNLTNVPVLHRTHASLFDAIEVLRASPLALLLTDGTFAGVVTQDDLARVLANRMDVLAEYSDGANEPMLDLHSSRLLDELAKLPPVTSVAVMKRETDFPCSFGVLLQRILLHSSGFALVLANNNKPAALITVRDVWTHAMSSGQNHLAGPTNPPSTSSN